MPSAEQLRSRLLKKLSELFQLDQPDLDFGIYRIMHAKAGEITQFLERDLLPQVRQAFAQYQSADSSEIKKKIDQLAAQVAEAGMDPKARRHGDSQDRLRFCRGSQPETFRPRWMNSIRAQRLVYRAGLAATCGENCSGVIGLLSCHQSLPRSLTR